MAARTPTVTTGNSGLGFLGSLRNIFGGVSGSSGGLMSRLSTIFKLATTGYILGDFGLNNGAFTKQLATETLGPGAGRVVGGIGWLTTGGLSQLFKVGGALLGGLGDLDRVASRTGPVSTFDPTNF